MASWRETRPVRSAAPRNGLRPDQKRGHPSGSRRWIASPGLPQWIALRHRPIGPPNRTTQGDHGNRTSQPPCPTGPPTGPPLGTAQPDRCLLIVRLHAMPPKQAKVNRAYPERYPPLSAWIGNKNPRFEHGFATKCRPCQLKVESEVRADFTVLSGSCGRFQTQDLRSTAGRDRSESVISELTLTTN